MVEMNKNILRAAFDPIFFSTTITKPSCKLKADCKMLVVKLMQSANVPAQGV